MLVSDSYEDIYARAEASLAKGELGTAQAALERLSERLGTLKPAVLERRPELRNLHVLSLVKQAQIRHLQGDSEGAMQLYRQLTDMAPENRDVWRREMALVQIDLGQVEAGLDELRAQAIAYPNDHRLWLTMGLESEALGRLDEAEEYLQRGARRASEPQARSEAHLLLFDFYRGQGRVEQALDAWQQAWQAAGREPDYVFPLYQMMWENGDLERARDFLRKEENPLRKGFYQGLLAAGEGNRDEAAKHWQRVVNTNPLGFTEGHEAWAEAALRTDHPAPNVISVLSTVLEAGNLTHRGLMLQAIAEARLGHTEHAEGVLALARRLELRSRPRREKLSASDWSLFDELVPDQEIKGQLRYHFEESSQGEAETAQALS
jgi:tetratricopeptide (TPR) repeat protein